MDIGIPTLIEHGNIEAATKMASENGFRFVELNMNLPWVCKAMKEEAKKLSAKYNIYYTIHADENLFFCDFNDRVAKAHLETMLDTIALAGENGMPLINFHMSRGVYFTLPDEKVFLFERYEDEYMEKVIRFAEQCNNAAAGKVSLCIENTGLPHAFIHRAVETLLKYPSFSLTWDVGHDYTADNCDTPFLLAHKNRISHMHLHDSTSKNCHLPLGKGETDLGGYLKQASPKRAVIEVKSLQGLNDSIPWLKVRNLL